MKILAQIPPALAGRGHPDSVPIACDCGSQMMWELKNKGSVVSCRVCGRSEDVAEKETP